MHVPYNLQPPVKNCHMLSNFAALQNLQTEGTKKKAVINIFDEINNIRMSTKKSPKLPLQMLSISNFSGEFCRNLVLN